MKSTPRDRLLEFFELTSDELDLLERLRGPAARFARHAEIRRAGDKVKGVFLLLEGWVLSSAEMPGGQRQVLKVHMPGDMLGSPSMVLPLAMETLTAVTLATIVPVPLSAFGVLLGQAPRLLAALFLSAQQERVLLSDRLAAVGRATAAQRFAALLVQLYDRLNRGPVDPGPVSLHLPLTQQDLADLLGITVVHVNRVLKSLVAEGLIARDRNDYRFDVARLRNFSGIPRREWIRNPSWFRPGGY